MKTTQKYLSILLSYMLIFMPLHAAGVQTDGNTKTTLDAARNGIEIVNIANPNSNGLSHNTFSTYNVETQGLILNNSKDTSVNTQLGGYIYGNTQLTNNAKVILNEVTSTNRSYMNGYTEVAGQRADLIIANPNGITVNGAGFINTSNVTLTTGTPNIFNGILDAFNITGGDISIEGKGLDASCQDSANIYTHFLKVNAAMHAKTLDIKLGQNVIDVRTKEIRSSTSSGAGQLLLDTSALGGMYANRINLVGTDKGLGVNLPPEVLASTGEISITNDGKIALQNITAQSDLTVLSNEDITATGNLVADTIALTSEDTLRNSGTVQAGNVAIQSSELTNSKVIAANNSLDIRTGLLTNQDTLASRNTMSVIATDAIINSDSKIVSLGTTTLSANSIDNSNGQIATDGSQTLNVTETLTNNSGVISSNQDTTINATHLDNTNAQIESAGDLDISTNSLININDSKLYAGRDLTLHADGLDNVASSTIESGNDLTINATSHITNDSNILADGSLTLVTDGSLSNNEGKIISSGAAIVINTVSGTSNSGTIQAENVAIQSSELTNSKVIAANNSLDIKTGLLTNQDTLASGNTMSVIATDAIINTDSKIVSLGTTTLSAKSIDNSNGQIATDGSQTLNVTETLINNSGVISSNQDTTINAAHLDNTNAQIESAGDLDISTNTLTINDSKLFAGRDLTLHADGLDNVASSTIESGNDLTINATSHITNDSNILADGSLTLVTDGSLSNNEGKTISSGGAITVNAASLENALDGTISGGTGSSQIVTSGDILNNARISSAENLDVKADQVVNNGYFNSGNDLSITATELTNNRTLFSTYDMYLYIQDTLTNSENANIYAGESMTIAADDANTKTINIINDKGSIQTLNGDIDIWSENFVNQGSSVIDYTIYYYNRGNDKSYTNLADAKTLNLNYSTDWRSKKSSARTEWERKINSRLALYAPEIELESSIHNTTIKKIIETKVDDSATTTDPAMLQSGHDLNLHVDDFLNQDASVLADNDINFDITNAFLNTPSKIAVNVSDYDYHIESGNKDKFNGIEKVYKYYTKGSTGYKELTDTEDAIATSLVQAGGSLNGSVDKLENDGGITKISTVAGAEALDGVTSTTTSNSDITVANIEVPTAQDPTSDYLSDNIVLNIEIPTDDYGLFVLAQDPASNYLIETNPEFTLYDNFISSDYMLEHIGFNPEIALKKVGDAFYENQLIRDSILNQTGRRFLDSNIQNDNDQYKYLMDNAIDASRDLELSVGVALTKEQINALQKDIVWMEEKVIQGQTVLVPVVYIANLKSYKIQGGRIIAGENIDLQVATLVNSGVLNAGADLSLKATDTITNAGGTIGAQEDMNLQAVNDITNTSGSIAAENMALTSTDGNVINQRETKTLTYGDHADGVYTLVGTAGSIEAAKNLAVTAAGSIAVTGSDIVAADAVLSAATVDIKTTVNEKNSFFGDKDNYVIEQSTTHIASNVDTDNLTINADETVIVEGSNVNAANNLDVQAQKIDVLAVNDTTYDEVKRTSETLLSTSQSTEIAATSTNVASNLKGGNINLTTTQDDINIIGSNVAAGETVALNSANDVNIAAGYEVDHEESTKVKTKMFDGGNLYSAQMDEIGSYDKTAVASNVSGTNVAINAGTANVTGSDISADESVRVNAGEINVNTAEEIHQDWETHETINVSFSQAAEGVAKMGLNLATGGMSGLAEQEYDKKHGEESEEGTAVMEFDASYSKTESTDESTTHVASNVTAGDDVTLKATASDITIAGSNVQAGGAVVLDAAQKVNIVAVHDTTNSTYKETSGAINLTVTLEDGMVASIDLALIDEGGTVTTAKGSTIQSGNGMTIVGQNDITLEGATLVDHGDAITLNAREGDVNVLEATNTATSYKDNLVMTSQAGGGASLELGDGQVEMELGRVNISKVKSETTETTVTSSEISTEGDLVVDAGSDITVQGSNIDAEGDVVLTAENDVTITEAKETQTESTNTKEGEAVVALVVKNEYAKIAYALKGIKDAKEGVEKAKDAYSDYEKDLNEQEQKLAQLKQDYSDGKIGVELVDVEEFQALVDELKEDQKFYETNIALATATVATAVTGLIAQVAKAASSSSTYGFNAGLDITLDAIEEQFDKYQESSVASNVSGSNITINSGEKTTVQGSGLYAANDIDITAKDVDILASTDTSDSTTSREHTNATISIDMYGGGGGLTGSLAADKSLSTSDTVAHTNAELLANNININTQETTNIIGATIQADDTLNLSTKNLNVASVQDSYKEKTRSTGASIGGSGAGVSSIGANQSKSDTRVKETVLTSLTGANVNIDVQEDTTLKGATIAAVDAEGNDNGNLNLSTGTLTVSSLSNTVNAKSVSANVTVGGDIKETDANNISLDYSNDSTNTKTKTLATLGSGTINIANTEESDTRMLNRDVANNEIDIYDVESHQGLQGELDTRLLTEDGRNQIKEDLLKSGMIVDTVKLIVTTERVGVEDFFSETDKSHTTYEAVKDKIAKTPELAEALNNPDLTPAQKEVMLDAVTDAVMTELGYTTHDNKLVSTDETGQNGEKIKGFYSLQTDDAYINDKVNGSTVDLVTIAGHEAAHAMDSQDGIDITQNREDNNIYADNYGENLASYTDFALTITGQGAMATTNTRNSGQVTTTPSVFNDNTFANNNAEFAGLDKELGDDRQLANEEVALNYTEEAERLKQVLADEHPNLSKEDIDDIFENTQRGMVNAMDNYLMNLQMNTTYQDKKEDISFVSEEARLYFTEAAEGQVYTDRNTLENRPMMDTNNYNDSTYDPSSDSKIIVDTAVSIGLTGAGLVSNPFIAIPAWAIDTYRNSVSNGFDLQNTVAPAILGNPKAPIQAQRTGAGLSIINAAENISKYNDALHQLEQTRDSQNSQELQNTYNNEQSTAKMNNTQSNATLDNNMNFIKVNRND